MDAAVLEVNCVLLFILAASGGFVWEVTLLTTTVMSIDEVNEPPVCQAGMSISFPLFPFPPYDPFPLGDFQPFSTHGKDPNYFV